MTRHFTINPTQRLTPTGRRAITRSTIEGPNQDKSTVSCVNRRVPHTLKSEHTTVDVSPPIACHGGTRGSLFGLRRMQNLTVNARDSRFILVRALDRDRIIALCLVGVSLCVGLIVKCCL